MTEFRILDQFPVFLDRLGVPASGGWLEFYDAGTTTPRDVYGDPDLTVNNGPTVLIGSDGRAVDQIWGNGSYYIRLVAADNTLIAEADDVAIPGGTGQVIPALVPGKFLTSDGAVMTWADVRQVPDPNGQADKALFNDGTNSFWKTIPTPENATSDVAVSTTGVSINDGTHKILIQTGSGSAANVGGRDMAFSVTFPTAFSAEAMWVSITPRYAGTVSALGNAPIPHLTTKSATGCSGVMSAGERDDTSSGFNFNAAVPFDWLAIGLVAIA